MHQAAVALTKTGVPLARRSASRSGVKDSHRALREGAATEDALDAASGPSAMAAATQPRASAIDVRRHRSGAEEIP